MIPPPEPPPADPLAWLAPGDVRELVADFSLSLPPPAGGTADDRARRDAAALAQVASLQPANAEEMWLAARYVAAGAHADDQLRQVRQFAGNFDRTRQINAQYALMLRTSCGARSLLLRVQTARRRLEADEAAHARHTAVAAGLLVALLGTRAALDQPIEAAAEVAAAAAAAEAAKVAAAEAAKVAAAEAKAAAAAAKSAARAPQRPVWETAPLEEPPPLTEEEQRAEKWLIAADRFATIYPMRTRLIRKFGKLPDDCGIEQPEPDLLHAIRIGDRFSLRWADELSKAEVYVKAGLDRHLCKYEDEDDPPAIPAPVCSG